MKTYFVAQEFDGELWVRASELHEYLSEIAKENKDLYDKHRKFVEDAINAYATYRQHKHIVRGD